MKKINVWCIVLVALFLVLGLAKVAAASSQEESKKDPDMARLEKFQPTVSPSFARLI